MAHAKHQVRAQRPWRLLPVGPAMALWPMADPRVQADPRRPPSSRARTASPQQGEDGLTVRTAIMVRVWGDTIVRVRRYRGARAVRYAG